MLGYHNSKDQLSIKNFFKKGEILFGKLRPYLKKYWLADFNGVCSTEIWVLNGKYNSNKFIYQLIQTNRFDYISNVSSGSKMPRADWKFMRQIKFKIPSIEEQEKIANFLTKVDEKLDLLEGRLVYFEDFKKFCMQQFFAQKLRFKNENGKKYPDWEEKKIGEIFDDRVEKGFNNLQLLSVTLNNGVMKRDEIDYKDNSSKNKSNYKRVLPGDIPYNSMRMWQGASGRSDFEGIVSPAYTILVPKEGISSYFFAYYFKIDEVIYQFKKYSQGLTSDTWNLKYPLLSEIKINIPTFNEQRKIVNFLTKIDNNIWALESELEYMKKFKKGLLQQMFIVMLIKFFMKIFISNT